MGKSALKWLSTSKVRLTFSVIACNCQHRLNLTLSPKGPPGTGKTWTLGLDVTFTILYLDRVEGDLGKNRRVIVVSEKNSAVDNIAAVVARMFKAIKYDATELRALGQSYNEPLVRVGNYAAVTEEEVRPFQLDALVEKLRRFRYPGVPKEMIAAKEFSILPIVTARVVFSTIDGILTRLRPLWYKGGTSYFPFMYLEQAENVSRLDLLVAALLPIKFISFYGDVKQLGVFGIKEMNKMGVYAVSHPMLFEEFPTKDTEHRLRNNYRSVPDLVVFPSRKTYNSQIVPKCEAIIDAPLPSYAVFDLQTSQEVRASGMEVARPHAIWNEHEARFALRLLEQLLGTLYGPKFDSWLSQVIADNLTIGIITPYRGQVDFIRSQIYENYRKLIPLLNSFVLTVSTVTCSQGREYKIVIASTVRTELAGFLKDDCRMNVMTTRAKNHFFVICNGSFCKDAKNGYIAEFIEDACNRGLLVTVVDEGQLIHDEPVPNFSNLLGEGCSSWSHEPLPGRHLDEVSSNTGKSSVQFDSCPNLTLICLLSP